MFAMADPSFSFKCQAHYQDDVAFRIDASNFSRVSFDSIFAQTAITVINMHHHHDWNVCKFHFGTIKWKS
jgi:hypothetical protein